MRGNPQALFGKRPTEKDPAKGTSPAVDFTRRAGRGNPPGAIPAGRPGPTQPTTARSTATRGSPPTSAWACTRCRATCGGAAGGSCRRWPRSPTASPPTPTSPGRGSGQWPAPGRPTPTRSPGRSSRCGRGITRYPGSGLSFIPTYSGGMLEGLMADEIVPETSWGTRSFGLADARTAQVQIKYATRQLHDPALGHVPVQHAGRSGRLRRVRRRRTGLPVLRHQHGRKPPEPGAVPVPRLRHRNVVTPHASFLALDVAPRQALATYRAAQPLPGRIRGGRILQRGPTPRPARSATGTSCSTSR